MTPIDRQVILARMNGVEAEVAALRKLGDLPFETYKKEPHFQLAEYHLHRALEGVFNITAHVNARKAGGASAGGYKDIARKYGELGYIDKEFADTKMVEMAGYRNRLVHFYADITPQETYKLIKDHLNDFAIFLQSAKRILESPEKFGVDIE